MSLHPLGWFWLAACAGACVLWFRIARFTEDDDVHETTAENDASRFWPVHRQRSSPHAGEENDAAMGAVFTQIVRGK